MSVSHASQPVPNSNISPGYPVVYLKPGKSRAIRMGNPWIFSGAVARIDGRPVDGDLCCVCSDRNEHLGTGFYSQRSSIAVRMYGLGREAAFSTAGIRSRIESAFKLRQSMFEGGGSDAYRVVNSEGDGLPGLIVDRYGEGVCLRILTQGMDRYRTIILEELHRLLSPQFVYERSDSKGLAREGMTPRRGILEGELPDPLIIMENGYRFRVDLARGQKTGFFLDQRENRGLLQRYAAGQTLCNCFGYTGAFSVYALRSGACRALTVDSSRAALSTARENLLLNAVACEENDLVEADVFTWLRRQNRQYSLIVLDPPALARHHRDVHKAARAYKDINLHALRRLHPGGVLFTFSCSQAIDRRLFRQIVYAAAADSGLRVQVLHVLGHPADHPVAIGHREGEYLKGLVVRTGE